ncbi:MAG TPA: C40 family peptidase [Mycobacteriales bacterium]
MPGRLAGRTAVAAVAGACVFCALGPATPRVATLGSGSSAPAPVLAPPVAGLGSPGWTPPAPAENAREASVLRTREAAAPAVPLGSFAPVAVTAAVASPAAVEQSRYRSDVAAAANAVEVALRFALAQVGKPYVWGAAGPDAYDCSGLTQSAYAAAGVALPRTSREQALVGTPVALADLQPGDLVFWAHDPADLATVHHVALYAGDGLIVQAPQPGEVVEVTRLWLDGYAGAVRVATGAVTGLPLVRSTGLPASSGPGVLPGYPGSPGYPGVPGSAAPGTSAPGRPAPGSGSPAPNPTTPGPTVVSSAPRPQPSGSNPAPPTTTPAPTADPTTPAPAPEPTTPAPAPTPEPTPAPTPAPTPEPTPEPTPAPSSDPAGPSATTPAAATTEAASPTAVATSGP